MEFVDKFDKKRQPLNKTTERYEAIDGEYKQSMHAWIANDEGKFLFQKRTENKKSFPGKWSVTGGGTIAGETTLETLFRECEEELGIKVDSEKVEFMMSFKVKHDFTDIYLIRQNFDLNNIVLQKEEVTDAKFISYDELQDMIKKDLVAKNVAFYTEILYKLMNYKEKK